MQQITTNTWGISKCFWDNHYTYIDMLWTEYRPPRSPWTGAINVAGNMGLLLEQHLRMAKYRQGNITIGFLDPQNPRISHYSIAIPLFTGLKSGGRGGKVQCSSYDIISSVDLSSNIFMDSSQNGLISSDLESRLLNKIDQQQVSVPGIKFEMKTSNQQVSEQQNLSLILVTLLWTHFLSQNRHITGIASYICLVDCYTISKPQDKFSKWPKSGISPKTTLLQSIVSDTLVRCQN